MNWSIATWNVNSLKARMEHVLKWLAENPVDILALQELKTLEFDTSIFEQIGYHVNYLGQKSYNGVAILSKIKPTTRPIKFLVHAPMAQARFIVVEFTHTTVICVYVPNGSEVGSDKYSYKLAWLDALHAWLDARLQNKKDLVIVGDFNIAPTIDDTYNPAVWEGKVLASQPERQRYQNLIDIGLVDTFELAAVKDNSLLSKRYTWWDYRAQAFNKNNGCRIDLILATNKLSENMQDFIIDSGPRAWDKASDHCPVIASFSGEL